MKKSESITTSLQGLGVVLTIDFREGEICDEDFIMRLSGQVFKIYGPYEEIISHWFKSNKSITIIALANGQRSGFAMIGEPFSLYDFNNASEILAIAVVPENQGKGIGENLLKAINNKAVNLDIKRLFLHTATDNFSAQRLFKRAGYRIWQTKRNFYPRGQDAFVMSLELDMTG